MKVYSRHDRKINAAEAAAASILNSLSGPDDKLWPHEAWPPMQFDRPLGKGARGGHGPIRYIMEQFIPGKKAVFRFDSQGLMAGVDGGHYFEINPDDGCVVISHVLEGNCSLGMWARWRLVVEPLHDALIEDAFDKVENNVSGAKTRSSPWSPRVRFLREMLAGKRKREERKRGV